MRLVWDVAKFSCLKLKGSGSPHTHENHENLCVVIHNKGTGVVDKKTQENVTPHNTDPQSQRVPTFHPELKVP